MATKQEVAQWMYEELMRDGYLSQARARALILEQFGYKFVNPGRIDTTVLKKWQKLTRGKVIWDAPDGMWRLKQGVDEIESRDNKNKNP